VEIGKTEKGKAVSLPAENPSSGGCEIYAGNIA
jgi:hypothetical protein